MQKDEFVCRHYLIHGRVQGVFYRASTLDQARALGLRGWVRNLPDGDVEAVASGPAGALTAFADWLWQGPPGARVESVEETDLTGEALAAALPQPFEIRH